MSPSEPQERSSAPEPLAGPPDRVPAMEDLLQSLEGVESVSIIPGANGGLEEIHVLSESGLEPKRIVRNVESALLAEAGVEIDHRIVSVAQRRGEMPDLDGSEGGDSRPADAGGRLVLEDVHIERSTGKRITCSVRLRGEERYEGEAVGIDHQKTRLAVVGKAVLNALREVSETERGTLMLDDVEVAEACGERMVVALIQAIEDRRAVPLVGAALVGDSPEQGAVLAVLDAMNRWVGKR